MDKNLIFDNGVVRDATSEEEARIAADRAESLIRIQEETKRLKEAYIDEFRDMRRELLNVLTGIALAEGKVEEFKVLRDALRNIPEVPAVASATTAAEAKAAIKQEYARIVSTTPSVFIIAFKELNG